MTNYACPMMLEEHGEVFRGKRRRLSNTLVEVSEPGKEYVFPGIKCKWVEIFPLAPKSSRTVIQEEHLSQIMKNITEANEQPIAEASDAVKKTGLEPGMRKRNRDEFEQVMPEQHVPDDPAETSKLQNSEDLHIYQKDVEDAGRKIVDLFKLEKQLMDNMKMMKTMLEEESRKRERDRAEHNEQIQTLRAELKMKRKRERAENEMKRERARSEHNEQIQTLRAEHKEQIQALRVELKRSQLFSANKFSFTCDVLENILVKLSYAIQKLVAEAIRDSSFNRENFIQVFEERNLVFLCYGRVLKRWLQFGNLNRNTYLQTLKLQGSEEEDEEDEGDGDDDEEQPVEQQPGEELGGEAAEEEKKRRAILRWLPKFLRRAEALVAEELGVGRMELKLTVGAYILRLKPERNSEAHRNQLHQPPQWRHTSFDKNPVTEELITKCLSPAPASDAPSLNESFNNILMLDIVEEELKRILALHWYYMSKKVLVKVIELVRSRGCSNIAWEFVEALSSEQRLPIEVRNSFSAEFYGGGWIIRPKRMPELWLEIRLSMDGEWVDGSGEVLERPFDGWPFETLLE